MTRIAVDILNPVDLGTVKNKSSFLATSFVLIFHFENSHYINITLVFKAKTKNKIINPKTSIYLFTVP